MIDLLQSLVNAVSAIFQLIINAISSLVLIISHIPTYLTFLTSGIAYLPAIFIPFISVTISLWVIYFVLGREH